MDVVFTAERETKRTVRYQEQPAPDSEPVVGTLYVQKTAVKELGNPRTLKVTIEAV